jgi:hypothetical protein
MITATNEQRDRSHVYKRSVEWCKRIYADTGLTLATMSNRKCKDMPCYPYCQFDTRCEGKE